MKKVVAFLYVTILAVCCSRANAQALYRLPLASNTGITTNKNTLGCDCFILGMFFIWHFLQVRQHEKGVARRNELLLCLFFFITIGWLLYMAHSSTSLGALMLAVAIMLKPRWASMAVSSSGTGSVFSDNTVIRVSCTSDPIRVSSSSRSNVPSGPFSRLKTPPHPRRALQLGAGTASMLSFWPSSMKRSFLLQTVLRN